MTTNPSAAASERARALTQAFAAEVKEFHGLDIDASALSRAAHMLAAELSAKDAEIERLRGINAQLCKDHNSLLLEIAKLQTSNTTARAGAIRECVEKLREMKNGDTVDVFSGALIPDIDGPWFLKDEMATTLESLLNEKESNANS